jgi:hypothetical protein
VTVSLRHHLAIGVELADVQTSVSSGGTRTSRAGVQGFGWPLLAARESQARESSKNLPPRLRAHTVRVLWFSRNFLAPAIHCHDASRHCRPRTRLRRRGQRRDALAVPVQDQRGHRGAFAALIQLHRGRRQRALACKSRRADRRHSWREW